MAVWGRVRPGTVLLAGSLAVIVLYVVVSTASGLIRLYRPMSQPTDAVSTQTGPSAPEPSMPRIADPPAASPSPPVIRSEPNPPRPVDPAPMRREPLPLPEVQPERRSA